MATGIESGSAAWTAITRMSILIDGQFGFASAAQNSFYMGIFRPPAKRGMIGRLFMAIEARVITIAATEFQGNNI
ncbi:MAG: hypothetical protein JWP88_172 [Flaviaesturariibacter sp.]|nr:hypothetical protein [Flaviaesturariibacter sp.]